MNELYLLRHGIAVDPVSSGMPDDARPLTAAGVDVEEGLAGHPHPRMPVRGVDRALVASVISATAVADSSVKR